MALIVVGLVLLLFVLGPTLWVKMVMSRHAKDRPDLPGTGGELAQHLIDHYGLEGVQVVVTTEGDHYDPKTRMVRLQTDNHDGRSVTAAAVAAHEVSHAIQHHQKYAPLMNRHRVVVTSIVIDRIGSGILAVMSLIGGAALSPRFILVGVVAVVLMGLVRVAAQLITLPVELDASFNRALPILQQGGYLNAKDMAGARQVLKAAAYTYVASALLQILNFVRLLRR